VSRLDLGGITVVSGAFALWVALTDAVLLYLKPSMRPYLVVAGTVLVLTGISVIGHELIARRRGTADASVDGQPADEHRHEPSTVGWLLVVPLVVAVIVGTDPLGAFAATRQVANRTYAADSIDLGAYLEASSFGGQTPALRVLDVVRGVSQADQRPLLDGRTIRLIGLVVRDGEADSFLLTRFVIGCCAGDAQPVQVRVRTNGTDLPEEDTWVQADVIVDVEASPTVPNGLDPVIADLVSLEPVDAPSEPYEYP
jgi:uncharacterized repeat protein (TIGR03943 family)